MSSLLQLLGFALLAAWAGLTFGWPSSLLFAGVELLLLGVALDDDARTSMRAGRERRRTERQERRLAKSQGVV